MIVFLCIISIITLILIIFSLSYIEVKIEDVVIESQSKIESILKILLKDRNYKKIISILDYVLFEIKIKILFLNKIPIFVVKSNNYKIKELLIKQYNKEMRKPKSKIENDKLKAIKISKNIIPNIIIKQTEFNMELGTEDAAFTAILTSIVNIAISIALPYITDVNKIQNIKYEVKPIYLDKNVFFLQFSGIISLKLVHIMNVICQKEEKIKNE